MQYNIVVLFNNKDGRAMIRKACKKNQVRFEVFEELVGAVVGQLGKQRRKALWDAFDDILDRIEIEE